MSFFAEHSTRSWITYAGNAMLPIVPMNSPMISSLGIADGLVTMKTYAMKTYPMKTHAMDTYAHELRPLPNVRES